MRTIAVTFLLFFVFQLVAFADQEGIMPSYTAETSDKKYIFVMLNPEYPKCAYCDGYSRSGMYVNDDSKKLLWSVDWFSRIFLPKDGKHIVRRGNWTRYSATYKEEIFSFFSEDKLLQTYTTKDLVDFPWLLPHSSSHYKVIIDNSDIDAKNDGVLMKVDNGDGYPINGGVEIDNENQTISIRTFHNDNYIFDLETGNVISSAHPTGNTAILLFGILIIGYFAGLYLRTKKHFRKTLERISNLTAGFLITFFLLSIPVISVVFNQINDDAISQDLPKFFDNLILSIQMFPKYLLAKSNVISLLEENLIIGLDIRTNLKWLFAFWFPLALFFAFCDLVFVRILSKKKLL